jgi:hypothetical protein
MIDKNNSKVIMLMGSGCSFSIIVNLLRNPENYTLFMMTICQINKIIVEYVKRVIFNG